MGFQSQVNVNQAFGIPGQRYDMSPMRALSYILNSTTSSLNIMGATAFSVQVGPPDMIAYAGALSSGSVYAGILVNPEMQASFGAGGQPLSPSMIINNGQVAALSTMGRFFVTLPNVAAVGDLVIFNTTTGALATITPGSTMPVGFASANAGVIEYTVNNGAVPQLAVIEITPIPPAV